MDRYSLRHPPLALEIESDSPRLLDAARRCLTGFMTLGSPLGTSAAVCLRLVELAPGGAFRYAGDEKPVLHESAGDGFIYRRHSDGFTLRNGSRTFLTYDAEKHRAEGFVNGDVAGYYVGSNCLTPLLNRLLNERGWFPIHAAGAARAGVGVLLIGPSGSGKSTTTATLARHGFDLIHDDLLWMNTGTTDFGMLRVPAPSALREDAARRLGIADEADDIIVNGSGAKWKYTFFADSPVLPQSGSGAPCRVLCFVSRWEDDATRVEPLPRADALRTLTEQSLLLMEPGVARPYMKTLVHLSETLPSFRVALGRDCRQIANAFQRIAESV